MGVAHVHRPQPAPAHLPDDGVAHQAVLDGGFAGSPQASPGAPRPWAHGHAPKAIAVVPGRIARTAPRPARPAGDSRPWTATRRRRYIGPIYSPPMLDLAILGLLEERGELHGYEIRRQLRDGLGLLANVSFGSLYPALARLEAAGAVEAIDPGSAGAERDPEGTDVPPTGSLTGEWAVLRSRRTGGSRTRGRRSKKAYRITAAGRRLFADLLCRAEGGEDPRSFGLRLAFAGHLPPQARLALLERRRLQLAERLADVRQAGEGARLGVYARSVAEHTADAVEHDIGWLDRLIEAERAAAGGETGRDDRTTPPRPPRSGSAAGVPAALATAAGWQAGPADNAAAGPRGASGAAAPYPPAARRTAGGGPRRSKHPHPRSDPEVRRS